MTRPAAVLALAAAAAASAPSLAYGPITTPGGAGLHWKGATVAYVINAQGSDDVADDSEKLAIRLAFSTWAAETAGALALVEGQASDPASLNVDHNGTHRVLFDESDATGYFPLLTGVVAITPLTYGAGGVLVDADVIFNGRDHRFSTSLESGTYDVRDVATHEVGHFIGLDHTPLAGASVFPFVATKQTAHRSLSEDDVAGAHGSYDAGPPAGGLSGMAVHTAPGGGAGSPIRGGLVVARRADGRVACGALTRKDGSFELWPVLPGAYALEISPLDGPMTEENLVSAGAVDSDFGSTVLGSSPLAPTAWNVVAGISTSVGAFLARPTGGPSIGQTIPGAPLRLVAGASTAVTLSGAGLVEGSMLVVPGEGVTVSSVASLAGGSQLTASLSAAPGTPTGLRDLLVIDAAGRCAIEAGALDVVAPGPAVLSVDATTGPASGGTAVSIHGSGFQEGASVIFGDELAVSAVVSPTQIEALSPKHEPGTVDVIVVSPDGQEGRKLGAFAYAATPSVDVVFPTVGSSAGGLLVRVTGSDFLPGASVAFDGAPGEVLEVSPTRIDVVAPDLPVGLHALTVHNTDGSGAAAASAFEAVAIPDPTIQLLHPDSAPLSGGTAISIFGSGLTPSATVRFGASLYTGEGGVSSPSVVEVAPGELRVVVPPSSAAGETSVLFESSTGQVALALGFVYGGSGVASDSGGSGGGGGSCAAMSLRGGRGPGDGPGELAGSLATFALLAAAAVAVARRARATRAI
jgi:matrixin/IPT/TIG domain-containing protein